MLLVCGVEFLNPELVETGVLIIVTRFQARYLRAKSPARHFRRTTSFLVIRMIRSRPCKWKTPAVHLRFSIKWILARWNTTLWLKKSSDGSLTPFPRPVRPRFISNETGRNGRNQASLW